MRNIFIAAIMLSAAFLSLEAQALAEEVTLKAEVDKTEIAADTVFSYKLTVSSSQIRVPAPKLPEFRGFNVLSQSNGSQLSVKAGKAQIQLTYIFLLAPVGPGVFTIGPAELEIADKTYSSAEFKIKVAPAKPRPPALIPKQKTSPGQDSPLTQEQPKVTL